MPSGSSATGGTAAASPQDSFLLDGGVVSTNDVSTIQGAILSLLVQELPPGAVWNRIWVVVSGSSDGSVEAVQALASADPRIQLIVEPVRRGKANALRQIMARSGTRHLILLNADAQAEPGAVRALVMAGRSLEAPAAVMARPVLPALPGGALPDAIRLLWYLHHRLHEHLLGTGEGNHLSDELLYLVRSPATNLPVSVINDGAYLGAWIRKEGGRLRYTPEAEVLIQVPRTVGDLLRQRTRIRLGHAQIRELTGQRPSTLPRFAVSVPREVLRWLRETPADIQRPDRALVLLTAVEGLSWVRSLWQRRHPRHDPVLWPRLRVTAGSPLVDAFQAVKHQGCELEVARSEDRPKG
jgi:hypothetical protein